MQALLVAQAEGELQTYYAYEDPLWIASDGSLDPAARTLLALVETAELDGLDRNAFEPEKLARAIARAEQEGSSEALAAAEHALSRTLTTYVAAMRDARGTGMLYEHQALQPHNTGDYFTLREAAEAPSLNAYLTAMGWMHPLYAELRQALASGRPDSPTAHEVALLNLERLRAIPADPAERYVLVDIAGARLWMYENGRPVDSMRVVVGKPSAPTPFYAGYIRYAIVNPYWNVPTDLVRSSIAPRVLNQGVAYLKRQRYEVLSSWGKDAELLDPAKIDWKAVRGGQHEVVVRQLPSPANAMGKVKYEFPNQFGIYLHDTPEKNLLNEEARYFSSGCIRLEDAERFGRWLMGGSFAVEGGGPERRIDLPRPVPVYLTYLTARVENGRIALGSDPYARDAEPIELAHAD